MGTVRNAPKLSVMMLTYNHELFIRQAVESALAQQTDFRIEIVIGEDYSTDRTRAIALELKQKYPDTLKLLLHPQNIGAARNHVKTFENCEGEFVAFLDGDDYWTDPTKLQKQVDALDSNPHWSMCFHPCRYVHEDGRQKPKIYPKHWSKRESTINDLFERNFLQACTVVFRNRLFGAMPAWIAEIKSGDWATNLLNAHHGTIGFLPDVMADYRIHPGGTWSQRDRVSRMQETLLLLSRIDSHFQGKYREQIDQHRFKMLSRLGRENEAYRAMYKSLKPFDSIAKLYAKLKTLLDRQSAFPQKF